MSSSVFKLNESNDKCIIDSEEYNCITSRNISTVRSSKKQQTSIPFTPTHEHGFDFTPMIKTSHIHGSRSTNMVTQSLKVPSSNYQLNQLGSVSSNFLLSYSPSFSSIRDSKRNSKEVSDFSFFSRESEYPINDENGSDILNYDVDNLTIVNGDVENFREYTENCLKKIKNNCSKIQKFDLPKINFLKNKKVGLGKGKKRVAIFDLDETLVHCDKNSVESSDKIAIIKLFQTHPQKYTLMGVNIRPYLKESLSKLKKKYYLIIFTSSHYLYADPIIDLIDPYKEIFSLRLYRHHCIRKIIDNDVYYIKDLRIFRNINIRDLVIIDNSILSFCHQIDNGIPILPFYDNKEDNELFYLTKFLLNIVHENDLRNIIRNEIKIQYYVNKITETKSENSHKIFNEKSGIFTANLSLSFLD